VDEKRRQAVVGSVEATAKNRGWFFGFFMDEPLLRSDLVEVAWQKTADRAAPADADEAHFHRATLEINVVISGSIRLKINDVQHDLCKGDFLVVWPESVVSDIVRDADTEIIVVRAPSVPDDKVIGERANDSAREEALELDP
jgi:mannose-6-phosphate isomerase-like protein (cupin superfamily)